MIKITRKTNSLVDWMSDCGGFGEALTVIGYIFVFSYNSYALKTTLAQNLVRFVPSKSKNSNKSAETIKNTEKKINHM